MHDHPGRLPRKKLNVTRGCPQIYHHDHWISSTAPQWTDHAVIVVRADLQGKTQAVGEAALKKTQSTTKLDF